MDVAALTTVAARATIRIGTSHLNTPSLPQNVGKWLYVYFSARLVTSKK